MPDTAPSATKMLPDWITYSTNAGGYPRFKIDIDKRYPQLVEELKAAGYSVPDPLDLYWLGVLGFLTRWDARYAIMDSGLCKKPDGSIDNIHQTLSGNPEKYNTVADPNGSKDRGWMKLEEFEHTPDRPVKKGESIKIDGVDCVCLEEFGCNRLRSGEIEPGKFRKETFVARAEGDGASKASVDGPEIFEKLRGYKCG